MKSRILKICFGVLSISSILFGADDRLMVKDTKKVVDTHTYAKEEIPTLIDETECNKYLDKVDKLFTTLESFNGEAKILQDNVSQTIQAYSLYANSLMKRYELCEKKNHGHLN